MANFSGVRNFREFTVFHLWTTHRIPHNNQFQGGLNIWEFMIVHIWTTHRLLHNNYSGPNFHGDQNFREFTVVHLWTTHRIPYNNYSKYFIIICSLHFQGGLNFWEFMVVHIWTTYRLPHKRWHGGRMRMCPRRTGTVCSQSRHSSYPLYGTAPVNISITKKITVDFWIILSVSSNFILIIYFHSVVK